MNDDKLNRWLTLGANFGVLVGIFLLIFEIRQNSNLMRVQVEQARSDSYIDWQRDIAITEGFASIISKFDRSAGSYSENFLRLTPVEQARVRAALNARFYDLENLHSQYVEGFVSEDYWQQRLVPGIRESAPRWKALFPPDGPSGRREFKDEVERILMSNDE